jgi:hypothetical protein
MRLNVPRVVNLPVPRVRFRNKHKFPDFFYVQDPVKKMVRIAVAVAKRAVAF